MLTTFRESLLSRGTRIARYGVVLLLASSAAADVCAPTPDQWYSSKAPLATRNARVLLVTHASREFNADASTIQGVQDTINILSPSSEVIYLHRGKFKNYFYPHCRPEWFYKSQGGEIKLDLEATDTIVMIGGYYNYCLGSTYIDVSKAIRRLKVEKDLRIVYVIDGAFEAIGGLQTAGGISPTLEQELMARVGLTFNYAHMAERLAEGGWQSDVLMDMLASVYASQPLPGEYAINAHIRNHYWKGNARVPQADWLDWRVQKGTSASKIDIYYLESKDLKAFFGL